MNNITYRSYSICGTFSKCLYLFILLADIKLENEAVEEGSELSDICLPPNVYHPRHALMNALKDWLPEFSRQKTVWGPMSKPQVGLSQPAALVPGVNTCE